MPNSTTTYKQTELGLIPSDWEVKSLGVVAEFFNGKAHEQLVSDSGEYIIVNSKFVSTEGRIFKQSSALLCPLNQNDIAIVMSDIPNGKALAKCFVIPEDNRYTLNQRIGGIKTEEADYRFLALILNRNNYFLSFDSGTGQTNLKKNEVLNCPIALPPTKAEQTAIASVLSTTDELISSLQNLIAKKKAIKQGTMQKLLAPRDDWETNTLKKVANYRRGSFPQPYGLDKWYDDIGGTPFVQVYDVDDRFKLKNETKRKISKLGELFSVYIKKGSIIVTLQGSIGRVAITQYDAYVDRTLLFFESFLVPFDRYFFMLLISQLFEKEKEKAPGGIIKTITKEALSSFVIYYPKSVEEQTAIAATLSDMDEEIQVLEQKCNKYKQLKTGLMQQLLTGKIRLSF